jgi:hypothetical protein
VVVIHEGRTNFSELQVFNRPFNCGLLSSILLAPSASNAVALAPSELIGVVEMGRARLECDRIDAIAGVMVLSEVARRLTMMSGSDASTCAAECGRPATCAYRKSSPSILVMQSIQDRTAQNAPRGLGGT